MFKFVQIPLNFPDFMKVSADSDINCIFSGYDIIKTVLLILKSSEGHLKKETVLPKLGAYMLCELCSDPHLNQFSSLD